MQHEKEIAILEDEVKELKAKNEKLQIETSDLRNSINVWANIVNDKEKEIAYLKSKLAIIGNLLTL